MRAIALKIIKKSGDTAAVRSGDEDVQLVYAGAYEEGDRIAVEVSEEDTFLVVQLDDAIGECFVLVKNRSFSFEIPFGEKKICYSPKSFYGKKHLLSARYAEKEEIERYKNLALNKYDQHGETNCFPHASANVETRGESVFAARNAINGNCENHSHGEWPYESWGINRNPEAAMKLEFGHQVVIDKMRLFLRADFPHDAWWKQVTVAFSDGSELIWELIKTDRGQEITFPAKEVGWLELKNLIKAEDPSPFPALTQLEVYGRER